jgi:ABC-type phosphate transport system substrate-binding protein
MKLIASKIALLSLLILAVSSLASAQEKIIRLSGVKFTYPIIEKWIAEYQKENPLSGVRFETSGNNAGNSGLQIIAHQPQEGELNEEQIVSYVGRYALIPVTSQNNPLLSELKKGISKKDLKNLVFEKSLDDEDAFSDEPQKEKYAATVYARDSRSSTAIALAEYFGQQPEQIRGKRIIGDDIFLLNAIKKDINGLTFNSLSYVFDINTRQLKQDLSILPLKLKSHQQEILRSRNIDQTISLLEETAVESIPVEKFGFVIPASYARDKDVVDFVNWILNNGQKFNNELGFLKLDSRSLAIQKVQLKEEFLSLK